MPSSFAEKHKTLYEYVGPQTWPGRFWITVRNHSETTVELKKDHRKLRRFYTAVHSILFIVIVLSFALTKGYLHYSGINSSITIKLQGIAVTNYPDEQFLVPNPDIYKRIWDASVSQSASQENGAFFVMTNVIITPNQTRNGVCAEDIRTPGAPCDPKSTSVTCVPGQILANGVMTGECIESNVPGNHTCEITGWCPVETDPLPLGPNKALLAASKTFKVFLKNDIEFSEFDISRSNVERHLDSSYLSSCMYHSKYHPMCPIFTLGTIVAEAKQDYDKMAILGGIISIHIKWDCDELSTDPEECRPTYTFKRLDDPSSLISGWNYRYAVQDSENLRTLYHAYGIRFVINVDGKGGKFSIFYFFLSLGAFVGLLGAGVFMLDITIGQILLCLAAREDKGPVNTQTGSQATPNP